MRVWRMAARVAGGMHQQWGHAAATALTGAALAEYNHGDGARAEAAGREALRLRALFPSPDPSFMELLEYVSASSSKRARAQSREPSRPPTRPRARPKR
jgi:hypothetical protein